MVFVRIVILLVSNAIINKFLVVNLAKEDSTLVFKIRLLRQAFVTKNYRLRTIIKFLYSLPIKLIPKQIFKGWKWRESFCKYIGCISKSRWIRCLVYKLRYFYSSLGRNSLYYWVGKWYLSMEKFQGQQIKILQSTHYVWVLSN